MIFVTGCARSGTSLITRILAAHGCHTGPVNRLHENLAVREAILKRILKELGADPLGQDILPDTDTVKPIPGLAGMVTQAVGGTEPRAYKDAKLCLVWPSFAAAFPDAKWVIVRRDDEKIAESCLRTPFMRHHQTKAGWLTWVEQHKKRFATMMQTLDAIEVWTDSVIADPHAFAPVAQHCGLTFSPEAVALSIDRKAWHPA